MCPSLIEIGSKTAEKNSAQTNKQTDKQTNRHYENNGHLAVNQKYFSWTPDAVAYKTFQFHHESGDRPTRFIFSRGGRHYCSRHYCCWRNDGDLPVTCAWWPWGLKHRRIQSKIAAAAAAADGIACWQRQWRQNIFPWRHYYYADAGWWRKYWRLTDVWLTSRRFMFSSTRIIVNRLQPSVNMDFIRIFSYFHIHAIWRLMFKSLHWRLAC